MHAWCARQMAWCLEHSRHTETLAILVTVAAAAANGEAMAPHSSVYSVIPTIYVFKESFFLQKLGMKYTTMSFMSQGTDEIKITRDHLTVLSTLCECEELPSVRHLLLVRQPPHCFLDSVLWSCFLFWFLLGGRVASSFSMNQELPHHGEKKFEEKSCLVVLSILVIGKVVNPVCF